MICAHLRFFGNIKSNQIKKSFPNVMFAILKIASVTLPKITDRHHHHPGTWHLAKVGDGENGIKGMVQNRPTIYRVINWQQLMESMEERDGFSVETEKQE